MASEPWGYLGWWVADHKNTSMLFAGPIFVIVGSGSFVVAIADADIKFPLISVAMLGAGLFIMLSSVPGYRAGLNSRTRTAEERD
jgi:hypothetical protein